MDTLGPDIFSHSLLYYRGFPPLEVENVLVTPVGAKIYYGGFFYCVFFKSEDLLREVPL